MSFNVYFDAKRFNNKVYLGVQIYEQGSKFEPYVTDLEVLEGATFLEDQLEAFLLALEIVEEEEFDDVILMNQNKILFDWLFKNNHESVLRESYYTQIKGKMSNIATNFGKIGTKVIQGNKNEAKKEIKKSLKNQETEVQDFTDMFRMETEDKEKEQDKKGKNNVVRINRRAN